MERACGVGLLAAIGLIGSLVIGFAASDFFCLVTTWGAALVITSGVCFVIAGAFSLVITCVEVSFVITSGGSLVITWIGSFFATCSLLSSLSFGGAKVWAGLVMEGIRNAVLITLRQTSLGTDPSYAAYRHSGQEIFF
ncbi:MAG: hypothetical protein DMF04_03860 [Verrucomicrobia bacterium]|nr:MAG: hypothetical protein DMF04_03860 [Verrucomicrobiota bacterium]